jgi:hypothetical protein
MYEWFEVKNFRCFGHLRIEGLERVNLIAGLNNAGKTSLLEALFVHSGAYNPELALKIDALRGLDRFKVELGSPRESPWDSSFYQFNTAESAVLRGKYVDAATRSLTLRVLRKSSELSAAAAFLASLQAGNGGSRPIVGAQILELQHTAAKQTGKHYMIVDSAGPRIQPLPAPPPYTTHYVGGRTPTGPKEDAVLFGELQVRNEDDLVTKALQLVDPRVKRLAVAVVADEPVIHGDIGLERMLPLPLMGGGMVRLTSIILRIAVCRNGVVLLDEFENGLHHSLLPKVWRAVREAAQRFNVQIFATTHSHECIAAAHDAFSEKFPYDLRLFRLERRNGESTVVKYDQEILETALESGLEIR